MVTVPSILAAGAADRVFGWPEVLAAAAMLLAVVAEWFHARRLRRMGRLAFGPQEKPALWTTVVPGLRAVMLGGLVWALASLFLVEPKVHQSRRVDPKQIRHVVLVLDVSPSMKLTDAGPDLKEARAERAAALLQSFFQRVPMEQVRLSVVATYTGAKPVVVDTRDVGVVKNILTDLPLSHAFEAGQTNLFAGLAEAARVAHAWPRHSTTIIVLSDGDTVPATGMPDMPPSISHTVLIGVGDTRAGQFIAGRQSRQDAATLKQVATRLRGVYHDGNQKHLPSDLLRDITALEAESFFKKLGRREYALIVLGLSISVLAVLPWALMAFGTRFRPGKRAGAGARRAASPPPRPQLASSR